MNKKGQSLNLAITVTLGLIVLAMIAGTGQDILQGLRDSQTSDTYAYNSTLEGQKGINEIAGWQDTMGLVAGAVVVISFVVGGFAVLRIT